MGLPKQTEDVKLNKTTFDSRVCQSRRKGVYMKRMKDLKIKEKIFFGYFVIIIICIVIGILAFRALGADTPESTGIFCMLLFAIVFSIVYSVGLARSMTKPVNQIKYVLDELCLGHLSKETGVNAEDEIGQMAKSLDKFSVLLKRDLIGAIEQISDGNISADFDSKDEKDEIAVILNKISSTVKKINAGIGMLTSEVTEGKLSTRGEENQYTGVWREIVENINHLIISFVKPINVTADYIERISQGNIPPAITDEYKGDFNTIKMNINQCISIMSGLVKETNDLIGAAEKGQLDVRGQEDHFQGAWRELVHEVNSLLETVVTPLRDVSETMQYMSHGNLEVKVRGQYQGEFKVLSDSVNTTVEKLSMVVNEISGTLGEIAEGNINLDNIQVYEGNFESISHSMNKIVDSLNTTLGEIHTAADQVSTGSIQVADGSQLLAQGATEQASSVEELTAAVTQVAAQTKENAANANQANTLVVQVKGSAETGNEQMKEMLEAMAAINEASANISKVIKVIDDMAFQTKILALNAAVEAARAGQHGKGFAVVAEEVRNLAARSANAAQETTALIEGSIERAQRGKEIANDTAKALNEIVSGVSEAAQLISGIAVSSNEQASGISQINIGINQVSQVVQTNSATSEESAAASEELSSQAELLKDLVDHFTLRGSGSVSSSLRRRDSGKRNRDFREHEDNRRSSARPQIILSDNEFGKY